MAVTKDNSSGVDSSSDLASAGLRKYVVPALSRYGTLMELTMKNGTKNNNDGSGQGCGQGNNFDTSCLSDVRV